MLPRRHARERQQAQTRQGCDRAAAFDKSGKREPLFKELGIAATDAAHGDHADFQKIILGSFGPESSKQECPLLS
jgi:hypothetical protein